MLQLILGGARSGKSRLAQSLAASSGLDVVYIATAQAGDSEMQARIQQHRDDRPSHWMTQEEPLQLAAALRQWAAPQRLLLVDCLTLWLTNTLLAPQADCWAQQRQAFLDILPQLPGEQILVSNETGLGVIPLGELTRRFVDEAGWLHQALAQQAQRVVLTVAGLPLVLKGEPL